MNLRAGHLGGVERPAAAEAHHYVEATDARHLAESRDFRARDFAPEAAGRIPVSARRQCSRHAGLIVLVGHQESLAPVSANVVAQLRQLPGARRELLRRNRYLGHRYCLRPESGTNWSNGSGRERPRTPGGLSYPFRRKRSGGIPPPEFDPSADHFMSITALFSASIFAVEAAMALSSSARKLLPSSPYFSIYQSRIGAAAARKAAISSAFGL